MISLYCVISCLYVVALLDYNCYPSEQSRYYIAPVGSKYRPKVILTTDSSSFVRAAIVNGVSTYMCFGRYLHPSGGWRHHIALAMSYGMALRYKLTMININA